MCLAAGPFVLSIVCPVPFACFYLPVCLVPCLLPISVCPAPCLLFSHFPSARGLFPLPASVCPHARLAALCCRFCLPVWRAGPLCPVLGRRQRAREMAKKLVASANSAARRCPFCVADGPGYLLARAIAAAAVPSFRLLGVRPSSCALSHSLSFVQSVDCVPILVLGFCKMRCVGEEEEEEEKRK
jgi:hypothetical protein